MRLPLLTVVRACACLLASALLGACAGAPQRALPAPALPAQWSQTIPVMPGVLTPWWRNFHDPQLDQLIAQGLAANTDLEVAALQWKRADLLGRIVGNQSAPAINAAGAVAASHSAGTSGVVQGTQASAGVSYVLDFWGRLAIQRQQAAHDRDAAREDCESAAALLEGSIANAWWEIAYQRRLLANADAGLAYSQRTLVIVGARYREGAVSGADVAQAEQLLAARRARRTALEQRLVELRNALAVMLDRARSDDLPERADLPDSLIPPLDAGLPATVLARRPDLRAASQRARSTLLNVDAVRLSFYPEFSLTGALGVASDHLVGLLSQPFSVLAAGLALPALQGDTPALSVAVAQTDHGVALALFRGKLRAALAEVENRLSARAQLQQEAGFLEESLKQARISEAQAEARYRAGATAAQLWLDTQETLRNTEDLLAGNHFHQLSNMVGLYLALGGDELSQALRCQADGTAQALAAQPPAAGRGPALMAADGR
ncbi:MAG: efflux transporter outer membrane subunit [Pseudomonadota bacterium]|nr:efflux transporter outer membrane subunit [Pseudomonadota bacterium]